jgi:hypothetical protein
MRMNDIQGDLKTYHKRDIAMQYFNLALEEYVKGENMFATLRLAGAAEEMFGKLVNISSTKTALERLQSLLKSWYNITGNNTPVIPPLLMEFRRRIYALG